MLFSFFSGVGIATMVMVTYYNIYYCVIVAWSLYYFVASFVAIPDLSMDGVTPINVPLGVSAWQSYVCGSHFGIEGQAAAAALVCKL